MQESRALVRVFVSIAAAALVEALSVTQYGQAAPPLSVTSALQGMVLVVLIAVLASISAVASGSLAVGLAVAVIPLSVASGWLGLLNALAASTAAVAAVLSYAIVRLRGKRSAQAGAVRKPSLPPSPTALAASSLSLYLLWASRTPIISDTFVGQVVYSLAAASGALVASLTSQDAYRGLAKGVAASLGPLGLAALIAVRELEGDRRAALFNSMGLPTNRWNIEPTEGPHGLRPGARHSSET